MSIIPPCLDMKGTNKAESRAAPHSGAERGSSGRSTALPHQNRAQSGSVSKPPEAIIVCYALEYVPHRRSELADGRHHPLHLHAVTAGISRARSRGPTSHTSTYS
jgi:hypothetical protein